jgi:hypothetical protein
MPELDSEILVDVLVVLDVGGAIPSDDEAELAMD